MRKSCLLPGLAALAVLASNAQNHSLPAPKVIAPSDSQGGPPSDAVALFNGTDVSQWVHKDGSAAKWPVENGAIVCKTGSGDIFTKQRIGSAQFHVEYAIPNMPQQKDQARGNSGVYIQGRYEIQVLDSFENPTYADGSNAALYGQYPPLVNASRKPELWQSYDIIFHAPICIDNQVVVPGHLTLLHNGVLVQDHVTIKGPTPGAMDRNVCEPAALRLQDHFHPEAKSTFMRFRNIWYRPLDN